MSFCACHLETPGGLFSPGALIILMSKIVLVTFLLYHLSGCIQQLLRQYQHITDIFFTQGMPLAFGDALEIIDFNFLE